MKFNIKLVDMEVVSEFAGNQEPSLELVECLGGERISCCLEAFMLEAEDETPLGVCTFSLDGEEGVPQPTIVAVWVVQSARRGANGYNVGSELLKAMVERCINHHKLETVRVDVVSQGGRKLVNALPDDLKAKLVIHEHEAAIQMSILAERLNKN